MDGVEYLQEVSAIASMPQKGVSPASNEDRRTISVADGIGANPENRSSRKGAWRGDCESSTRFREHAADGAGELRAVYGAGEANDNTGIGGQSSTMNSSPPSSIAPPPPHPPPSASACWCTADIESGDRSCAPGTSSASVTPTAAQTHHPFAGGYQSSAPTTGPWSCRAA